MSMLSHDELRQLSPAEAPHRLEIPDEIPRKSGLPEMAELDGDGISRYKVVYEREGAGRANVAYGYAKR